MPLQPGRRLLALIFTISFISVSWSGVILAATPEIADEFGQDDFGRGAIIGVSSVFAFLGSPIVGLLADRIGRRKVLAGGLFLFGLAGALGTWSPNWEVLLLSRALVGLGNAGLIGLAVTSIADFYDESARAKFVGFNGAALSLGLLIHPLLGGFVAESLGWRYAVAMNMVAFPVAIAAWFLLPEATITRAANFGDQMRTLGRSLKHPLIYRGIALSFAFFFVIFGLEITLLPEYLRAEFDLSESRRAFVFAVGAAGAIVASSSLGWLRQRLSRRVIVQMAIAGFVIASLTVGLAGSVLIVGIGVMFFGASEGMGMQTIQESIATTAGTASRAMVVMAFMAAGRLGQFSGSFFFGFLAEWIDYSTLFVIGAAIHVVVLLVSVLASSRRSKRLPTLA